MFLEQAVETAVFKTKIFYFFTCPEINSLPEIMSARLLCQTYNSNVRRRICQNYYPVAFDVYQYNLADVA